MAASARTGVANRILDGAGAPASGAGFNNDWYINTSTGAFYKKVGGAWVFQFNTTGGSGGGIDQSYVDTHDATTLSTAEAYTDAAVTPKASKVYVDAQDAATYAAAIAHAPAAHAASHLGGADDLRTTLDHRYGDVVLHEDLVTPLDPRIASAVAAMSANNQARGARVVCRKAGTLSEIYLGVGTQSGNISLGVFDPSSSPAARLWTSGAIACPAGGNVWQLIGNPGLTVVRGQPLEFWFSCDNTTATFLRVALSAPGGQLPAAFTLGQAATPVIAGILSAAHPVPATLAGTVGGSLLPMIIGRIT